MLWKEALLKDLSRFVAFRGISRSDLDYWFRNNWFPPSDVPAFCDEEVLNFIKETYGYDPSLDYNCSQGLAVVNVTNDFENARGYGDIVIGIIDDIVVDWLCDEYGIVDVDDLSINDYGSVWEFVEIPDDLVEKVRKHLHKFGKEASLRKISYIKHIPGHKGSDGELRPWCIMSHETNKILQCYPTKAEAEEALKRMQMFKHMKQSAQKRRKKFPLEPANGPKNCYNCKYFDIDLWENQSIFYCELRGLYWRFRAPIPNAFTCSKFEAREE